MKLIFKAIKRWISRKYDDYRFKQIVKKLGGKIK